MPIPPLTLPAHGEANWDTKLSAALETLRTGYNNLESAVDTSGGIPTGGTPGQVLTKNSTTDGDVVWTTVSLGGGTGTVQSVNTVVPDGTGNITLVKSDLGLGNVDNTSDLNKPLSTAAITALGNKVDTTTLAGYATTTALNNFIATKGAASGLAPLDSTSKVPLVNIPVLDLSKVAPGTKIAWYRNVTTGNWDPRPSARTDITICWTGILPAPLIDSTYAILSDEYVQVT